MSTNLYDERETESWRLRPAYGRRAATHLRRGWQRMKQTLPSSPVRRLGLESS